MALAIDTANDWAPFALLHTEEALGEVVGCMQLKAEDRPPVLSRAMLLLDSVAARFDDAGVLRHVEISDVERWRCNYLEEAASWWMWQAINAAVSGVSEDCLEGVTVARSLLGAALENLNVIDYALESL